MSEQFMNEEFRQKIEDGLRKAFPDFEITNRDTLTPGDHCRCVWTVTAGVILGQPIGDYTRRWCLTSEQWDLENEMSEDEFKRKYPDGSTFHRFKESANDYAKHLHDPRSLNWVRVDWMWM